MTFEFDAFLSYRHSDGRRAAEWLCRRLEGYRLPAPLQPPGEPRRLSIYLDRIYKRATEDFFEREIQEALRSSRHLIVVQTPDAVRPRPDGEANWLEREVEFFRSLPQGRNISVALAAGGFEDPLPAGLDRTFRNIERVDLRRRNLRERLVAPRRVQDEFLSFVATLYQVPRQRMAELRQEEARRRGARNRFLALLAALILGMLVVLSIWALVSRLQALRAQREVTQALSRADLRAAEELSRQGEGHLALRYLARAVRGDPQHTAARAQLFHHLLYRRWLLPEPGGVSDAAERWVLERVTAGYRIRDRSRPEWVGAVLDLPGEPTARHFSPDGRWLLVETPAASTAETGSRMPARMSAQLWDIESGRPRGQPCPLEKKDEVHGTGLMGADPSGRRILVKAGNTARLWDVEAGRFLSRSMEHDGIVTAAAFSPDGSLVLTASYDETARLWDAATGRPAGQPMRHQHHVLAAEYSPDGRRVVTASQDFTARLWAIPGGRPASEPLVHDDVVRTATFSPDGSLVLTASDDGTARFWRAADGQPVGEPLVHPAPYQPAAGRAEERSADPAEAPSWNPEGRSGDVLVAFSPDGRRILTALGQETRLWDAGTGQLAGRPVQHPAGISQVAFSPDGGRLLLVHSDEVRLLRLDGYEELHRLDHEQGLRSSVFSPDGSRVLTVENLGKAYLWDSESGRLLSRFEAHRGIVFAAAFSPDGRRVVTASYDQTARLWSAATGAADGPVLHPGDAAVFAAFSPGGERVLTLSVETQLWDTRTGKPQGPALRHPRHPVHRGFATAAFSPDGRRALLSSREDHGVYLWRLADHSLVGEPRFHGDRVTVAAFSPDGRRFVTAAVDGTTRLWDGQTGRLVAGPLSHPGVVVSAAFSPDGRQLVTGLTAGAAQRWHVETGAPMGEPMRHLGWRHTRSPQPAPEPAAAPAARLRPDSRDYQVLSAAFDPAGRRVATAARNGTVWLWEVPSTRILAEPFQAPGSYPEVGFSPAEPEHPGGRQLVVSGQNWSLATGLATSQPLEHDGLVRDLAFSPDGRWIASASDDEAVRLWDVASQHQKGGALAMEGKTWKLYFNPDGRRLVTISLIRQLRWWDVASAVQASDEDIALRTLREHRVVGAAFGNDGDRIATWTQEGEVWIWSLRRGKPRSEPIRHPLPDPLPPPMVGGGAFLTTAALSPDGRRVATAAGGSVRLWNAGSGESLGEPIRFSWGVSAVAFSPGGERLAIAAGPEVQLRRGKAGEQHEISLQAQTSVTAVEFSRAGERLLTTSGGDTAQAWEADSGQPLGEALRHDGAVRSAVFSPDGERVLTASADGTARVWDAGTGRPIGEPLRHADEVTKALFSPDGERIATAAGSRIWLWDTPAGSPEDAPLLARLAEAVAGHRLGDLGAAEPVPDPQQAVASLRREVESAAAGGSATLRAVARWFLADCAERPVSPLSAVPMREAMLRSLAEGTEPALRRVQAACPEHPLLHLKAAERERLLGRATPGTRPPIGRLEDREYLGRILDLRPQEGGTYRLDRGRLIVIPIPSTPEQRARLFQGVVNEDSFAMVWPEGFARSRRVELHAPSGGETRHILTVDGETILRWGPVEFENYKCWAGCATCVLQPLTPAALRYGGGLLLIDESRQ